jgi:hypothetical protein
MRVFEAKLKIVVDDIEPQEERDLTTVEVAKWVKGHFEGCDLASIPVVRVKETTGETEQTDPDE